jgi:hypothetical protein
MRYLHDAMARGRDRPPAADSFPDYDALAAKIEADVGLVLTAAHANRRRPCPLSELQTGRWDYGTDLLEDWLRTLRPLPPAAPRRP